MIYCVEDDKSILELLLYALQGAGWEARGFECAADFFIAVTNQKPELILLDIMLPDKDGLHILQQLKSNACTASLLVIMLTARGSKYDKVLGLDEGADDYISKPFSMLELISRIKTVLRRTQKGDKKAEQEIYQYRDLYLNTASHIVRAGDKPVNLTLKEFALLEILLKNPHQVLSREVLSAEIWCYDFESENRTVDVHIRTLRQKLGEDKKLFI